MERKDNTLLYVNANVNLIRYLLYFSVILVLRIQFVRKSRTLACVKGLQKVKKRLKSGFIVISDFQRPKN